MNQVKCTKGLLCKALFLCFLYLPAKDLLHAQDTAKVNKKVYKHELGVDVTSFIRQFFNFSNDVSTYTPSYYLTYRRHFKKSNLRVAMGGGGRNLTSNSPNPVNEVQLFTNQFSIDFRIGYEFLSNIGKRWQIFYGADFRPTFFYNNDERRYLDANYLLGNENISQIYGIAPVLGFRFKINERISLTTETSLAFNVTYSSNREYARSLNPGGPVFQNNPAVTSVGFSTSYYQPVSVIFTFDI